MRFTVIFITACSLRSIHIWWIQEITGAGQGLCDERDTSVTTSVTNPKSICVTWLLSMSGGSTHLYCISVGQWLAVSDRLRTSICSPFDWKDGYKRPHCRSSSRRICEQNKNHHMWSNSSCATNSGNRSWSSIGARAFAIVRYFALYLDHLELTCWTLKSCNSNNIKMECI